MSTPSARWRVGQQSGTPLPHTHSRCKLLLLAYVFFSVERTCSRSTAICACLVKFPCPIFAVYLAFNSWPGRPLSEFGRGYESDESRSNAPGQIPTGHLPPAVKRPLAAVSPPVKSPPPSQVKRTPIHY